MFHWPMILVKIMKERLSVRPSDTLVKCVITTSVLPECFCFLAIKRSNRIEAQVWRNETARSTVKTTGNLTVEVSRVCESPGSQPEPELNWIIGLLASWNFPLHFGWLTYHVLTRNFLWKSCIPRNPSVPGKLVCLVRLFSVFPFYQYYPG